MDFGTDLILKRPLESSSGESRREAVVMAGSNSRCCLPGYGFLLLGIPQRRSSMSEKKSESGGTVESQHHFAWRCAVHYSSIGQVV